MKPIRYTRVAACLSVALQLVVSAAFAQPHSDDTAGTHVRRGVELRRLGNDEAALAEFQRAQAVEASPRILAQIGLALQALGRWPEAEEATLAALSDDSDAWVEEHRELLRESLAAAQHHLGWMIVDCNVGGAELLINGRPAGKLPLDGPVRVIAGEVVLQVKANGYEPVLRKIDVLEGSRAREAVTLVQSQPPSVTDRDPASAGPPIRAPLAKAPATVLPLDLGNSRRMTVGWVTFGVGGTLAAGGLAAAAISAVYTARYNDDSRCFVWPQTRDQRCGADRGIVETTRVTAIVALATSAIAVGAGAFLLATTPPRQIGSAKGAVACRLAPGFVGCTGRF